MKKFVKKISIVGLGLLVVVATPMSIFASTSRGVGLSAITVSVAPVAPVVPWLTRTEVLNELHYINIEAIHIQEQQEEYEEEWDSFIIKGAVDWFSSATHLFPRESDATVIDVATGQSFRIRRTFGTNHADVEPLTIDDTNIMRSIWGAWSWDRRAVVVITDTGYVLAGSMNGMPHAGVDGLPTLSHVHNRSGGFGSGQNFNGVHGNGVDGHFCIHFLNSTNHGQTRTQPCHQAMVQVAAEFINTHF